MKIIEIGTGYTTIPAAVGAATELVVENLIYGFNRVGVETELIDIAFHNTVCNYIPTTVFRLQLPHCLEKIKDGGLIHLFRRIFYSIKVGFFLKNHLKKQNKHTIIHFHNQYNFFFVHLIARNQIKANNIKTLYTIHSPGWSVFSSVPVSLLLERYAIQKVDVVISLTHIIKNKILQLTRIVGNKIVVIPNGVSTEIFKPNSELNKENIILNIGSICDRKNQLCTIMVLKDFLVSYNYKFYFAGKIVDNNYFEQICSFIKTNKLEHHVIYLGEIEPGIKLQNIYNQSKFYISHSKQEAYSLVILESMASGLPVILADTFNSFLDKEDGLKDVVKILPNNELLNELTMLVAKDDEYLQYQINQLKFVQSNYCWNKIAQYTVDVIS